MRDIYEGLRWAAFKIVARNKDHHVKILAFRGERCA